MQDLIERLEKATGPDRELANEVLFAGGWRLVEYGDGPSRYSYWTHDYCDYEPMDGDQPDPTSSIDAALTLVPRGWIVDVYRGFDDDDEFWSKVILTDSFSIERGQDVRARREVMSYGPGQPPRFISAAVLKARAALNTDQRDK